MRYSEIKKHAEKMGISTQSAVRMRIRYLLEIIDAWDNYIEDKTDIMPPYTTVDALNEIIYIRNYEVKSRKGEKLESITEEMIEAARAYPIEQVIEFNRGLATSFCHSDKTPSLTLWKGQNKARCFPCGKTFNPIDILIERDGKSFIEAVKELC